MAWIRQSLLLKVMWQMCGVQGCEFKAGSECISMHHNIL